MTNQELADYIQAQLDQGIDLEIIKKLLIEKGWSEKEFEEALLDIVNAKADQFKNPVISSNEDNNEN